MFEVYATRWDSSRIVSQIIPARGLSFSFPLSDHGDSSFSATVEPGRSFWRSSLGGPASGCLIAESQDQGPSLPIWGGRLKNESEQDDRAFTFQFGEWGSFLNRFPAIADTWPASTFDVDMYLDILARVQAVSGQNLNITGIPTGAKTVRSTRTVNEWENRNAGDVLAEIASAQGGPEFYYPVGGTLANPQRYAVVGERLGDPQARFVLEYVENTPDPTQPPTAPTVALLSQLFPGTAPRMSSGRLGRRGGNVLAVYRTQDADKGGTVAREIGSGDEAAQIRYNAEATGLLAAGWPRVTTNFDRSSVTNANTLARHGQADLAAMAGIPTGWSLVTRGKRPDWRQVVSNRGSMVRVELDTDRYATRRPLVFEARVLNVTVAVPDDGGDEQVRWDISTVLQT